MIVQLVARTSVEGVAACLLLRRLLRICQLVLVFLVGP